MAHLFTLSRIDSTYSASANGGPKFFVGKRTTYSGNVGLINLTKVASALYAPEAYEAQFGFWAYFIAPTAKAESGGSMLVLNTYDRAKFTFSFMQYAAHVPNGDFVKFFRKLLQLPSGADYFPNLAVQNGRISRLENGVWKALESDASTQALMDYLNPGLTEVEDAEIINAARFIHWATNDAEHRRLQVETAITHFRENMVSYAKRYNLNNVPDKVCLVIADIRHQGRANSQQIIAALNTAGNWEKALTNLLALGKEHYKSRIATLTAELNRLVAAGKLGAKKYSTATGDFV